MLDMNKVISLLQPKESNETATKFVQDIFILKRKLATPGEQDWYFRKGIESNVVQLKKLIERYNEIKEFINSHDLDEIIRVRKEAEVEFARLESLRITPLISRGMVLGSKNSEVRFLTKMIVTKKRYDSLFSIEYYEEHPGYLADFF